MAFVFPGQNSHFVGMGRDLWDSGGVAQAMLERADEVLGFPLSSLMFEGPEEDLTATQNQQPAILTHSAACLALLEQRGIEPQMVAGHSLGEYSALIAAGCLEFGDALRLVRRRGELMAAAGGGAMAAVIGLDPPVVEEACRCAQEVGFVAVANYNCPGQVVVTGEPEAVHEASRLLQEAGAKRVLPLRVSGAFHSPLMASAAEQLRPVLEAAPFRDARVPLVGNVDARPRTSGDEIRDALAEQITSPVLWEPSVRRMAEAGIDTFVEVGPGKVVSGLIRRIVEDARAEPAGTVEAIEALSL
ncbi:MAG: ACP S-malonyltransferase [Armatimonadetes bacterium]|nr:ACP S-malonyltransferase [Armatimonadota bacterium]